MARGLFSLACIVLLFSCTEKPRENGQQAPPASEEAIKRQFIRANQQLVQKENDEMDVYARNHRMPFIRTASGVRYYVYRPSSKGDSIRPGMKVTMDYRVLLFDGTVCYSSEQDGKRVVQVEEDNIESGIHRGLQYLKTGDQALLMIPSHLAHGLLGDMNRIPPQTPILYDVKILP